MKDDDNDYEERDDDERGRFNENHQEGRNNFNNNGDIYNSKFVFGGDERVIALDVYDTMRFHVPLSPSGLAGFGGLGMIGGALGVVADAITVFSAPGTHPFLNGIASYVQEPVPYFVFFASGFAFLFGWILRGREHTQAYGFTLSDVDNGIDITRKAAPCFKRGCGGTMRLTTLSKEDDTPYFICGRNRRHIIEFDHTLRADKPDDDRWSR